MGSVLIGTVVSRYSKRQRQSVNRLNNNLEPAESVFDSEELQKESPIKRNFETGPVRQSVNIGKLAKINGRRVKDVEQVIAEEATMTGEKREHLYKILVIGELGTGKTSFIKRYVHQFFSQNYRATIGVDFALKVLNWDQSTIIRLQLWDIAGQERFGNMTRVYYKEAVGAFIVFDVTRSATFDAVLKWKQDLDSKVSLPDGSQIPCVLLANKCDQQKQGLVTMPAKIDEFCQKNGFSGWFETSAKDNVNIEESAKALVSKILINDKLLHNDIGGGTIVLNADDAANQKKQFCSC